METKKERFAVTGMSCAACSAHVDKAVRAIDGVADVSVNLLTNSMTVDYGSPATAESICAAVRSAGYGASPIDGKTDKRTVTEDTGAAELRRMIVRLVSSAVLLLPLMYISMGHVMWGWPLPGALDGNPMAAALAEMLIAAVIMLINSKFFVVGTKGVLRGAPNMDTLVAMGSAASFIYSTAVVFMMSGDLAAGELASASHRLHGLYFESAAMIVTLITVGKTLETYSKGKTTNAVKSLMDLTPKTATLLVDGNEITVPAEDVKVGDVFVVRPGERIAADGVVIYGEGAVDESALTGESVPADKVIGSKVSAATVNKSGYLRCEATHVGEGTTISQIIAMVENAASTKAPISKIADKVSGVFVPAVIVIAAVTAAVWLIAGREFGFALARAISVLVISCPCALGLATPVAIMVGSGIGAKNGLLFKTASSLEAAGKVKTVVLDKTGTLTKGQMEVTDVITLDGADEAALMNAALSLEIMSEHPVASAVADYCKSHGAIRSEVDDFEVRSGGGVVGRISGKTAALGNAALIGSYSAIDEKYSAIAENLAKAGKTPVYIAFDGKLLGIIAVADAVRDDSRCAVAELKRLGIRTVMLTGDNRTTASAVAENIGIDEVIADVLPGDKENAIASIIETGSAAMVGDGINDAPALTRATVGIAIGAGTDVAIDAADVVLISDGIGGVPSALHLSRAVLRNIKENLFWAFFYNCICIPVAAGALIPAFGIALDPMFAAAAMSLSSVSVVLNALRLNFVKPGKWMKTGTQPDGGNAGDENDSKPGLSGADMKGNSKMKKKIGIEGMMCPHCQARVQKALESVDGVSAVDVDLDGKCATVTLSSDVADEVLTKTVSDAGYTPTGIGTAD